MHFRAAVPQAAQASARRDFCLLLEPPRMLLCSHKKAIIDAPAIISLDGFTERSQQFAAESRK